ncbi:hypothetical protein BRYFOR_09247 [Marvinbryantia formatexigens DSM 14469]|uniref:Uncharacterized protein n=1 Tax=Marvinbryantia formatexigens DSM 14469 TaxID=478749 RepID=C6LKQ0_9FIRM|nr:hypothetical protein BRYFOR_09247 [Marvinbryantia formatexigens DSM 14469]
MCCPPTTGTSVRQEFQVFALPANNRHIRPVRISDSGVSPPDTARCIFYYYYTKSTILCQCIFA